MKLFFILGNQLFPLKYLDRFKKDHLFFMAEDKGLCTYEKHHKQKILLFLSSMRSHADSLKKNKFKLNYLKIEDKDFTDDQVIELAENLREGVPMGTSVFDGAAEDEIKDLLRLAGYSDTGQMELYDGRTGDKFSRPVTVGYMYIFDTYLLV